MLRSRQRKIGLEVDDSTPVICTAGYRPSPVSRTIERGECRRLGDALIKAHPEYWSVVIPVTEVER